ncbi:MAG: hypothetical protein GX613_03135 [Chloroflexi bacterium]|nr:hypothetical protein [Chloroflexota bacterium]
MTDNQLNSIDELRRQALEEEIIVESYETYLEHARSDRLFGMTAAERMFVSIGCFLVTSLAGFLLLLVMGKIVV